MPKEPTQFKTTGLGTTHRHQPISVKFPPISDTILRDESIISDRSAYIRSAVLKQLHSDGLIADAGEPSGVIDAEVSKRVKEAIAYVVPRIAIRDRGVSVKAFRKLIAKLGE